MTQASDPRRRRDRGEDLAAVFFIKRGFLNRGAELELPDGGD